MKKIILGLMLAMALVVAPSVFAQSETGAEMQAIVDGLRAEHESLKAQVDAGEITLEDAIATWQARIQEVRAMKDAHFAERTERAQEKINQISEKNPEVGARLQTRLEESRIKREAWKAQLDGIREQVQAGEMTIERAIEARGEIRGAQEAYRVELETERAEFRAENEAARAERQAGRAERQGDRPEGGFQPPATTSDEAENEEATE